MADGVNWSLGLTPNFSNGFQYLEAGQQARRQQEAQAMAQQRRAALTQVANGAEGGMQALNQADPALGIELQQQQAAQAQAQQERQRVAQERAFKAKISLAEALVHAPKGEGRMRIFQGLGSVLPDVDENALSAIAPHIDDDDFLRGLAGKFDQELKFFNTGNGSIVGINAQTGQPVTQYQAPRNELDDDYKRAQIQAAQARAGASMRSNRGGTGGGSAKRSAQQMSEAELKAIAGIR